MALNSLNVIPLYRIITNVFLYFIKLVVLSACVLFVKLFATLFFTSSNFLPVILRGQYYEETTLS
jgi:hypothetical protein